MNRKTLVSKVREMLEAKTTSEHLNLDHISIEVKKNSVQSRIEFWSGPFGLGSFTISNGGELKDSTLEAIVIHANELDKRVSVHGGSEMASRLSRRKGTLK